jgi:hypothetical protein
MRAVLLCLFLLACSRGDKPGAAGAEAAPTAAEELRVKCCAQCAGAASRDPTGADISGKTCTSYPAEWGGGAGVDDECRGWFVAQPVTLTVADCRAP